MRLDQAALNQLFLEARTNRAWQPRDVPDSLLIELIDLMKMGPTAFNSLPARVIFVKSKAAKERLRPLLTSGNVDKTMAAPATAIIAYDLKFYDHPPTGQNKLTGYDDPERAHVPGLRNGSLQGGYFIMAVRALGLDVGPMSGFDNAGVDREFFAGTDYRSNFLCNVGYGDKAALRPRQNRFTFDEMAKIL
jgi:3-hydroxypropanoate dehydrogenase